MAMRKYRVDRKWKPNPAKTAVKKTEKKKEPEVRILSFKVEYASEKTEDVKWLN